MMAKLKRGLMFHRFHDIFLPLPFPEDCIHDLEDHWILSAGADQETVF